jgi:hypothetical protein
VKVRGLARVRFKFKFTMAAYNLIRMPRLLAAACATRTKTRRPSSVPILPEIARSSPSRRNPFYRSTNFNGLRLVKIVDTDTFWPSMMPIILISRKSYSHG